MIVMIVMITIVNNLIVNKDSLYEGVFFATKGKFD